MTTTSTEITLDNVPPDPVAAYKYGLAVGREACLRILDRAYGPSTLCCNGHEIWIQRGFDGDKHLVLGIRADGHADQCHLNENAKDHDR